MNTLHRYIFRQVALAALMAVGLFVFVMVAGNAMREVVGLLTDGQLSAGRFFQMLLLLVPYVAAFALPLGLLSAILIVLGRLSAQREITAMKTAGISLYSISSPIIFLALIGMVFSLFVNFYYSPLARTAYKEALPNILHDDPTRIIKPRTFIKALDGFILYVEKEEGDTLRDIWLWVLDERERVTAFARAKQGKFEYDKERELLYLTAIDAVIEYRDKKEPENFTGQHTILAPTSRGTRRFDIPIEKIIGKQTIRRKLSMLTLPELLEIRSETLAREEAGDPEAFGERIRIQMQIQEHFASAMSILSLALLAIPLGIKASRTETYANLGIALALAMVYYVSVVLISLTEKNPALRPDLLIWLPNICFQGLGGYLLHRANER